MGKEFRGYKFIPIRAHGIINKNKRSFVSLRMTQSKSSFWVAAKNLRAVILSESEES